MKTQFFRSVFLLSFITATFSSYACGTCGSSLNNYLINNLYLKNKNYIDIKWEQYSFETLLEHSYDNTTHFSEETFNSLNLSFNKVVSKNWQLNLILPYSYNFRINDTKTIYKGLGDISVLGTYTVLNLLENDIYQNSSDFTCW